MRYAAMWPVIDVDARMSDLQAEARLYLARMLVEDGVKPTGTSPEWRIDERPTGAVFLRVELDVLPALTATPRQLGPALVPEPGGSTP